MQHSAKQRKDSILGAVGSSTSSNNAYSARPSGAALALAAAAAASGAPSGGNPFNNLLKSPRAPARSLTERESAVLAAVMAPENMRPSTAPSSVAGTAMSSAPSAAAVGASAASASASASQGGKTSGLIPGMRARSGSNPHVSLSLNSTSSGTMSASDPAAAAAAAAGTPTPTSASAPLPVSAAALGAQSLVASAPALLSSAASANNSSAAVSASAAAAAAALANNSVSVLVRVRPANMNETRALGSAAEGDGFLKFDGHGSVVVQQPGAPPRQFNFDSVLDQATTQGAVYEHAGRPVVDSCLAGFNGTILVYGQTGSGKTFTMMGPTLDAPSAQAQAQAYAQSGFYDSSDQRGLIPRVLADLFSKIRAQQASEGAIVECRCSFLEIYNIKVFDLLAPPAVSTGPGPVENTEVRIMNGEPVNLVEHVITSAEDALAHLRAGNANRHSGATLMNAKSSRSHSFFTVTITARRVTDLGTVATTSKLTLVDLAGSECAKTTGASGGSQLNEASNINKSLSELGSMLRSLVQNQQYKSYRNSKLTLLLRGLIGGNSKLCLIANISPSPSNAQETVTTLNFASDARQLPNKAFVQSVVESGSKLEGFLRVMGGAQQLFALLTGMHERARQELRECDELRGAVDAAVARKEALQKVLVAAAAACSKGGVKRAAPGAAADVAASADADDEND